MFNKTFKVILNNKIKPFNKVINVDADKSISIRSLIVGSISHNISYVSNILESEDVISTMNCLKKLGVKIYKKKNLYYIYGKGLGSLTAKKNTKLNFGNSGTLARLLIGLLSTNPNISLYLSGDNSLKKRSMKKLILLMSKFGASFYPKGKFCFPLKMVSSKMPVGIRYKAGVSAQLKSAVIFAGLNSFGNTNVKEVQRSRDHTENILLGNPKIIKINDQKVKSITIIGKKYLNPLYT